MDRNSIVTKTGKGMREAVGKTHLLQRDLQVLVSEIDGKSSVGDLLQRRTDWSEAYLEQVLAALEADGFIRELPGRADDSPSPAGRPEDEVNLDFTTPTWRAKMRGAQMRREADEQALRKAVETARRWAAIRSMRRDEARAIRAAEKRARREAEEKVRREAEEKARREAEERARREAEERARREAEERAKREAEERAKREAEERAKREAEERARREAEERARREAEEKVKREAAERARRAAEEHAKQEALERSTREALQRSAAEEAERGRGKPALRDARQKSRRRTGRRAEPKASEAALKASAYRRPIRWHRPAAWGLAWLFLVCLILLHLLPFNDRIPLFEQLAAEQFKQPVKIRSVHLSLIPQLHWRIDDAVIGADGQIRVPRIRMAAEYGTLFSDTPRFTMAKLDAPLIKAEAISWLLFAKAGARGFAFTQVDASGVVLDTGIRSVPMFDLSAKLGAEGRWQEIVARSTDGSVSIELRPDEETVGVDVKASSLALPFAAAPKLTDVHAAGSVSRSHLDLRSVEGVLLGGRIEGSAKLAWNAPLRLECDLHAKRIEAARLYPGLFESGFLEATAAFALPLRDDAQAAAAPRAEGRFAIHRGTLGGVDMGSVLYDLGTGGRTQFAKLDGHFLSEGGRTQWRELSLDAGAMTATGAVDIDTESNIHGRVSIALKFAGERHHANLDLAGVFKPPYGRNVQWIRRFKP